MQRDLGGDPLLLGRYTRKAYTGGADVLVGRWLSLLFLFKLAIVLPLALFPASVARALTVAGARPGGAALAALASASVFAAPAWGLGPDAVLRLGLFTQAWGLLFFPLALAYSARYLLEGRNLGRSLGYALACGLCHPFVAVCLAPGLGVLLACRRGRGFCRAALLLGLVLAASAFFWLPIVVDWTSFGGFPARRPDEAGIAAADFFGLLVRGHLLDEGRLPLVTIAALGAVVAAALRRDRWLGVIVLEALSFGVLVVVGPAVGPIAGDLVPGIRFLAPLQLGLSVAAGLALADGASACAARFGASGRVAAALLLAGFTVVLVTGAGWRLADLTRTLDRDPAAHRDELATLLPVLADLPPGRIATARSLGSSIPAWSYLPAVYADKPAFRAFGGAALQSSTNYVYVRQAEPRATAHLYGIRYALARRASVQPGDRVLARTEHFAIIALDEDAGGLFAPIRVVGGAPARREPREQATWAWLSTEQPARGEHLAIGEAAPDLTKAGGRVLAETSAPSRYAADVEADGAGGATTFVLRVTYHPRWQVSVDGRPAPLRRVTPDFLAVDVPPGRHRVELIFVRPWWIFALLAGGIGLCLGAGLDGRRRAAIAREVWPAADRPG